MLILFTGCLGALIGEVTGASDAQLLRQTGVPAEAEILRVWDTGTTLNDDPVIGMEVEIEPDEGDPFRAVIPKTLVSRIAIPQFQPGERVAVRYDPHDPSRVALDNPPFPSRDEPESDDSDARIQTSATFSIRLCARSREDNGEPFQTVFRVTGPDGQRYEIQRTAPTGDESICVRFPDEFEDADTAPGRYRYEIRVDGWTAERGDFILRRQ